MSLKSAAQGHCSEPRLWTPRRPTSWRTHTVSRCPRPWMSSEPLESQQSPHSHLEPGRSGYFLTKVTHREHSSLLKATLKKKKKKTHPPGRCFAGRRDPGESLHLEKLQPCRPGSLYPLRFQKTEVWERDPHVRYLNGYIWTDVPCPLAAN